MNEFIKGLILFGLVVWGALGILKLMASRQQHQTVYETRWHPITTWVMLFYLLLIMVLDLIHYWSTK